MKSILFITMVVATVGLILRKGVARKRYFAERCSAVNGTAIDAGGSHFCLKNDRLVIVNKE
jgi:hypothetical protein